MCPHLIGFNLCLVFLHIKITLKRILEGFLVNQSMISTIFAIVRFPRDTDTVLSEESHTHISFIHPHQLNNMYHTDFSTKNVKGVFFSIFNFPFFHDLNKISIFFLVVIANSRVP